MEQRSNHFLVTGAPFDPSATVDRTVKGHAHGAVRSLQEISMAPRDSKK